MVKLSIQLRIWTVRQRNHGYRRIIRTGIGYQYGYASFISDIHADIHAKTRARIAQPGEVARGNQQRSFLKIKVS